MTGRERPTPERPDPRDHGVHFSSAFSAWRTPRGLFSDLHAEFNFTVDGCSTDDNALLPQHWTERDEPLLRSWAGERVFMNPPYGRQLMRWMEKAWTESAHALVVALVPSRTDTAWWHEYAMKADEIRFIRGRLDFEGPRRATRNDAPFPSAVIVWGEAGSVARQDDDPDEELEGAFCLVEQMSRYKCRPA